jgi:hypothetical protein
MTILKNLFWVTIYTLIVINCLAMTAQYFMGMNNIAAKIYGLFEDVNITALF